MTEERVTETTDQAGNTHTTRTVVTDGGEKSGGFPWAVLALIAVVAIVGFVAFSQIGGAEIAKDNAVAEAANAVGEAAGQVGEAAQEAGDAVQDVVDN